MYEEKSYVGMTNCWICGGGADILIDRRVRNTLSRNMGSRPDIICSDCETKAKENEGIWVISIRDGEEPPTSDLNKDFNPYRTGGLVLIRKTALIRLFRMALNPDVRDKMINMIDKNIYFYLEDKVWDGFGIPRGEVE